MGSEGPAGNATGGEPPLLLYSNVPVYALDAGEPGKRETAGEKIRRVALAGSAALPAQVLAGAVQVSVGESKTRAPGKPHHKVRGAWADQTSPGGV